MKLTIAEPKLFVDSVGIISDIVNEVQFLIDTDKIEIVAMDPANVAMVVYKLLSSAFSEYSVEEKESIAVSLDGLKAILRRVKADDVLTLELDKEKNKLRIQLKGATVRTFHLALIDIDRREQKVPDLNFAVNVEMPSTVLDEAIHDMDVVAESVAFIAQKGKLVVEAESNLNAARTEIVERDDVRIRAGTEDVKSKYSVEYLKKIVKGSKLAPTVSLQFGNDYPLMVEYVTKDKVSFSVILAPRVSND
jgi:proliferating cell nuclear antigen